MGYEKSSGMEDRQAGSGAEEERPASLGLGLSKETQETCAESKENTARTQMPRNEPPFPTPRIPISLLSPSHTCRFQPPKQPSPYLARAACHLTPEAPCPHCRSARWVGCTRHTGSHCSDRPGCTWARQQPPGERRQQRRQRRREAAGAGGAAGPGRSGGRGACKGEVSVR